MKSRAQEINERGFRPVSHDNQYDSYFNMFDCVDNSSFEGFENWVRKHQSQTKEISKILKGSTLKETVENIHWFLYCHIQYNTVFPDFEIKSPICAWQDRFIGTDCKTYATFASSILINLGIKHYLRDVGYDEGFHIYVIVPINQENPKLNPKSTVKNDYYIIDSSRGVNQIEKPFVSKRFDLFMDPHKEAKIIFASLAIVASIFIFSQNKD